MLSLLAFSCRLFICLLCPSHVSHCDCGPLVWFVMDFHGEAGERGWLLCGMLSQDGEEKEWDCESGVSILDCVFQWKWNDYYALCVFCHVLLFCSAAAAAALEGPNATQWWAFSSFARSFSSSVLDVPMICSRLFAISIFRGMAVRTFMKHRRGGAERG